MTGNRHAPSGKFRFLLWLGIPALVMGFVAWDSIVRSRHIVRVSASYGVTVDPPAQDPSSPTGYERGLRSMLLPEAAEDTAHWVMQTQTMIARGEWRLRKVDYDNAPQGREVHWAAPFHWWLAGLAGIDHLVTGAPIGISVERATFTSGPVMFALLLIGLIPLLQRKFSAVATALVVFGAVGTPAFYSDFLPGRADHHGLVNICGLFMVLFIAIGSLDGIRGSGKNASSPKGRDAGIEPTDQPERSARRWFIASAVAGGVGLWISAATIIPVLGSLGLGVLVGSWFGRGSTQEIAWMRNPGLFRTWGLVGGAISLTTYLIEYFPSHFGMRLEVNHPLYAAAWVAGGELLCLGICVIGRVRPLTPRDRVTGGVAVGLLSLAPLTILVMKAKAFILLDPFLWELHKFYIAEEQGLVRALTATGSLGWNLILLCLPVLLLIPPLVMALRSSTDKTTRICLLLTLCPAMVGWIQSWNQVRWLSLAYALSVPALALFFRALEQREARNRQAILVWSVACGLLFVPGAVRAARQTLVGDEFTTDEIRNLAQRDVAHWLRLRADPEPVVVATMPPATTLLISQGGFSGLDTLYWENTEGLKHAAELFAAPSAEAAHALVRQLGVTHIVFFSWNPFEIALAKLARGQPMEAPIPTDAFIVKLLGSSVPPPWLRAIPFSLPEHTSLEGKRILIWEVTPDQTPAAALAHAANYYLETGKADPGNQLASDLAKFGDNLAATVMLGGLASRQQDAGVFSRVMERIMTQLPQADSLPLEDHVHLVVVLAVAQRVELARAQLQSCVKKMDEKSLRHLTPGTLSDLLSLCEGLDVAFPDATLKQLAERLVPPIRRK